MFFFGAINTTAGREASFQLQSLHVKFLPGKQTNFWPNLVVEKDNELRLLPVLMTALWWSTESAA